MKITDVNSYIHAFPQWQSILEALRTLLLATELEESLKWGAPVYCLNGKNVVGLVACKTYAGLWFYQGAMLDDQAKVLINAQPGKTQAMRQWRFSQNATPDQNQIIQYLTHAIENQKNGKVLKTAQPKTLIMPAPLTEYFTQQPLFKQQFAQLSQAKQREYAEYISTAKRQDTKLSRLQKIIPMVEQGTGLHDKYR